MYSNSSTDSGKKWRTTILRIITSHASHASHVTHRSIVRYTFIDKDTKCFVTLLYKLFITGAYLPLSISEYEIDENISPRQRFINYYIVNLKKLAKLRGPYSFLYV